MSGCCAVLSVIYVSVFQLVQDTHVHCSPFQTAGPFCRMSELSDSSQELCPLLVNLDIDSDRGVIFYRCSDFFYDVSYCTYHLWIILRICFYLKIYVVRLVVQHCYGSLQD